MPPSDAPAGIYGTIICASVMAAEAGQPVGEVAIAVFITVLVYWAAERWSELVAGHLRGERLTWSQIWHVFATGWPMVQASYTPLVLMGAAWLLGANDELAINIALVTTIALLAVLGVIAGRRAGLGRWGIVGSAVFTGLLGSALVILKALLH
jgi:hypothetical protein